MKYAAMTNANATATAVRTANERGCASTTRPSHAWARAVSASARKSDMRHLLFGRFIVDAITRHPDVNRQDDQRDDERDDMPAPPLQVARVRHVARKDEAAQQRIVGKQVPRGVDDDGRPE